jgi:hypothetical protein
VLRLGWPILQNSAAPKKLSSPSACGSLVITFKILLVLMSEMGISCAVILQALVLIGRLRSALGEGFAQVC